MPDDLDAIRARIDILELVGERVKLSRVGKYWKGLCPFHTEKTPSFHVYPDKQRFHCFGCQASGDIFEWTKRIENVEFRGALDILAARAGVELTNTRGASADTKERAIAAVESAARFFADCLNREKPPFEYLLSRGLDESVIKDWEIGFAPDDEESLISHLKKAGVKLADAAVAEVISGNDRSGYRPFFRGRIMFPIRDERGKHVGFSGRAFGATSGGKYINSRESILFNKSQTMYGLDRAKARLLETRQVVLVEGQLDAIACHRAGITNAVAPLGTAFNERHITVLKRWCDKAILLYDSDEAGRKAAERVSILLDTAGIACRIARLMPGEDPDSLLQKNGAPSLLEAAKTAVTPLRFAIEGIKSRFSAAPGIEDQEFWQAIRTVLRSARDKTEADRIVTELASLHPKGQLSATVAALRASLTQPKTEVPNKSKSNQRPRFIETNDSLPFAQERHVLLAALQPELRGFVWARLADPIFATPKARQIADVFLTIGPNPPTVSYDELLDSLPDEHQAWLLVYESNEKMDKPIYGSPSPIVMDETTILAALARLDMEHERRSQKAAIEIENSDEALAEYFRRLGST